MPLQQYRFSEESYAGEARRDLFQRLPGVMPFKYYRLETTQLCVA